MHNQVVSRLIFSFGMLAVACGLHAQNTAVISGTVADPSGAVVPKAGITLIGADTSATVWHGETNESGVYRAPEIPVGRYNLRVEAPGFKRAEVKGINLVVDQRAAIDVKLETGATAESITVNGEAAGQLATDTSSLGNVINTSQVQDLPLPNRSILNLLSLTPGVSSGGAATGINSSQLSINGSRTVNSEFMVDGVSVVSGSTGGVQTLPSADAIREFKVLTSAYSAEYGRTSGATVTMVINSGTNQFHGGAYEYFRNEDLNANNYFNNLRGQPRSEDRYNLFGAKLGGPVWIPKVYNGKEKTFFFFDYEGLRQISPYANISSVPSAAFRTGNFSTSAVPVYSPASKAPFPGNVIPASLIDPAAAKILGVLPGANSPGSPDVANGLAVNNLVEVGSSKPGSNATTTRIDENLNESNRLFGTLTHYSAVSPLQPTIPGPLENSVGPGVTSGYQAALGLTHTFSPTMFMEARMGFWRNDSEIVPPSAGLDVAGVLGIARSLGGASPTFNISGGWSQYGLNSNTLRSQIDDNYQPSLSVSKVWRNHLLKFGTDLRLNEFNIYNPGGTGNSGWFTGNYTFTGEITSGSHNGGNPVNALADFLLGDVKTSGYALPQPPAGRRNYNLGFYGQDDWKITHKLTLNLGLRWEYESPLTSSNKIYSRVDPTTGQVLFADINSSASLNLTANKTNFAPRLGFAYTPIKKTVIRAGVGIFYSQIFSDLGAQVLFPGYTISQAFSNLGTGVAQPFSLSQGNPLIATQNLHNPQSTLSQFSASNPISASASFGQINPLPYSAEWNFGVQREFFYGTILDVNYVGSAGVHLPLNLPYNQVPVAQGTALAQVNTAVNTQNARPYPNVGSFSATSMAGHSSYDGLQVSVHRQYGANLAFIANYSWSKSIDDGDGLFAFSQPTGLNAGQFPSSYRNLDRSLSEFDRTNNFTTAIQYHTTGSRWLRDFDIDPILTARTGLPTTINQNNLNPAASQLRPNVIDGNSIYMGNATPNGTGIQYLVPPTSASFPYGPVGPLFVGTGAARTLVLPAGIGSLGRNTVRSPGELDLDLAIDRKFTLTERLKLSIRVEAFNILNHTNFQAPNTSLSVIADPKTNQAVFNSPSFGLITASNAARFMQLVARFEF
jgi:hypothetical protein